MKHSYSIYMRFAGTFILLLLSYATSFAQCSICTRTAGQLSAKAATGLNAGIIFLMVLPTLLIVGIIWYVLRKKMM